MCRSTLRLLHPRVDPCSSSKASLARLLDRIVPLDTDHLLFCNAILFIGLVAYRMDFVLKTAPALEPRMAT
jgi:hypothetical protein